MSRTRRRLPVRVRSAVARRAGAVIAERGVPRRPAWLRAGAERAVLAHAASLARRRPDAARALLESHTSSPLAGAAAWRALARVRRSLGDAAGAVAAAHRAVALRPDAESLLLLVRLAESAGMTDEAALAVERLAATPPRSARQAREALETLARSGRHRVEGFVDMVTSSGLSLDAGWARQLLAEVRLETLHEQDPAAFEVEAARVRSQVPNGARAVLRVLCGRRDWQRAAAVAADAAPRDVPVAVTAPAARRALQDGRTSAAVALAEAVLRAKPDDVVAREVVADGSDQLAVLRAGLPEVQRAPRGYEPAERHVLSVLMQSLPVQSGGYATRSHGILTGIRDLGWVPRAVTRYGYPYDRWKPTDSRTVPPVDEVDGIPYHRLIDGPDVRAYPQYPLRQYVARYADRIVAHAEAHRASLIHAASFQVNGLAASAAARRLGIPLVYEMRGLEELMKVSRDPSFAGTDRHALLRALELRNCMQADGVLVITKALAREMAERGVPADKLTVLPNGVRVDLFTPRERDADLEGRLGYRDKVVIGYVGGLVDYEGLELLLEATAMVTQHRHDVRLLVVGDGHHERAVRGLAAKLRLGGVATFTGRVPHAEVARYLSLVDVAPFPRLPLPVCELIAPIKPFESMAMGKAVVVSSVAALTEIVEDGVTGLVAEKGSAASLAVALERLVSSAELRARLGDAARAWVLRERDWSQIVRVVDEVYRGLLDLSGDAPGR